MPSLKSFIEEEQERGDNHEQKAADHPEIEAILKYYQGELLPGEVTRIEDHFGHCHSCRNIYLSLVRPSAFEDSENQKALQSAWERFQEALSR